MLTICKWGWAINRKAQIFTQNSGGTYTNPWSHTSECCKRTRKKKFARFERESFFGARINWGGSYGICLSVSLNSFQYIQWTRENSENVITCKNKYVYNYKVFMFRFQFGYVPDVYIFSVLLLPNRWPFLGRSLILRRVVWNVYTKRQSPLLIKYSWRGGLLVSSSQFFSIIGFHVFTLNFIEKLLNLNDSHKFLKVQLEIYII